MAPPITVDKARKLTSHVRSNVAALRNEFVPFAYKTMSQPFVPGEAYFMAMKLLDLGISKTSEVSPTSAASLLFQKAGIEAQHGKSSRELRPLFSKAVNLYVKSAEGIFSKDIQTSRNLFRTALDVADRSGDVQLIFEAAACWYSLELGLRGGKANYSEQELRSFNRGGEVDGLAFVAAKLYGISISAKAQGNFMVSMQSAILAHEGLPDGSKKEAAAQIAKSLESILD